MLKARQYKQFVLIPFVLFALAGALLIYPWISIIASTKYHSDVETVYANAILDDDRRWLSYVAGTWSGDRTAIAGIDIDRTR